MKHINTGAYIGYILNKNKLTLYFKNGHYTLGTHSDWSTIGWHPIPEDTLYYRGNNISKSAYIQFMFIPENSIEESTFISEFVKGAFDDESSNARFFEYCLLEDYEYIIYTSEGKLITPDNPDFIPEYDEEYANEIIKNVMPTLNYLNGA